MEYWYVAHVRSNFERRVREHLRGRGIEEFLPLRRERRRGGGTVERPLFPGYVFGRFELRTTWLAVLQVPGVVKLLGGLEPEPVPDDQVEAVRGLVESPFPLMSIPFFTPGELVDVEVGHAILQGTVERMSRNRLRVAVSMELMGRAVAVEVDVEDVRSIGPALKAAA